MQTLKSDQDSWRHPRLSPGPAWLRMSILASSIILTLSLLLPNGGFGHVPVPLWIKPFLAILAGVGLTLPLAILWTNRKHLKSILRFRFFRYLAAGLMAFFTPVFLLSWVPSAAGFWFIVITDEERTGQAVVAILLATLSWIVAWPLASALIWGLSRPWRVPAFLLFNLGETALVASLGLIFHLHFPG